MSKKETILVLVFISLLTFNAVVWISSKTGLHVPNFGVGYVIENKETGEMYQLRGAESFRIRESTIEFIPYNAKASIKWNGNWELNPGLK